MVRYNQYGFLSLLKLIVDLFKTKLLFNNSRLIRFPIIIRGRRYIDFGSKLTTGVGCRIEAYENQKSKKRRIKIKVIISYFKLNVNVIISIIQYQLNK